MKFFNKAAFSLVELSMVLVLMALLAVSVTSGASLIESAKIRSFLNIVSSWQKDINTFFSLTGRLPSNLDNSYYIGDLYNANWTRNARKNYRLSDIGVGSYDGVSGDSQLSSCSAFWLDLYLKKINSFKPTGAGLRTCGTSGSSPIVFKKDLRVVGPKTIDFGDNNGKWPPFRKEMHGVYFQFVDINTHIKPRIFYKIDKKIDDGLYNNGNLRSFCYSKRKIHNADTIVDYKTAITNDYTCHNFYYKLIDLRML